MKEVFTRIEIESSTDVVWRILADLDGYHLWNPFIPEAKGLIQPGHLLAIKIRVPGREAQEYKVKVLKVDEGREIRWLGHFHVPGLIDGDHFFELRALTANRTEFIHREYFRGILVPFTWKSFLNTRLREGFEALNRSLKTTAERASPP